MISTKGMDAHTCGSRDVCVGRYWSMLPANIHCMDLNLWTELHRWLSICQNLSIAATPSPTPSSATSCHQIYLCISGTNRILVVLNNHFFTSF